MIYFQFEGILKMNFEDFAFYCQTILKEKKKNICEAHFVVTFAYFVKQQVQVCCQNLISRTSIPG